MEFRTQIPIPESAVKIDYSSRIGCLGSCFSEHIAKKFDYYKFKVASNPFGILFSPIAIENIIKRVVNNIPFGENDVFCHNDQWSSFEVHSCLNESDKEVLLVNLNQLLKEFKEVISNSTQFFVTYGSAWVYRLVESKKVVANCHKLPQKQFEKLLLTPEEISISVNRTIELVRKINPRLNVVLTISPVRHLKDGFVGNQRSKSNLIAGIHELIEPTAGVAYFPSYEIMIDELRDYRFYLEDMIHPNTVAIEYIWRRLQDVMISHKVDHVMKEVAKIQKMKNHKPFDEKSEKYSLFLQNLTEKIKLLESKVPTIKFE